MEKAVIIAVVLFLSIVTSASENKCPNIAGEWLCSLEINDFPEGAISTSYRNFQKDLKDGEVSYDIAGMEFTAKPDVETVKDGITYVCRQGKLVITFKDEIGIDTRQTISRVSPTVMTAEILQPASATGNYKTFYNCEKVGEGVSF